MMAMGILTACLCYFTVAMALVLAGIVIYGLGKWPIGGYDEAAEEKPPVISEDESYQDNSEYDWGHNIRNYKNEDYD